MSSVDVLSVGRGPGLVVIPGASRRAHHYRAFAAALAADHTVHVIERRGRGGSPAQGPDYGLHTEIEDTLAVLRETGSERVFGHSYGGLVALHVALWHNLAAVAAYEPGVSINGEFPLGWLPRFDEQLARGHDARATVTFLNGLGFIPAGPIPAAAIWLAQRLTRDGRELRQVLPTIGPEVRALAGLDSDGSRYAAIESPVLLLGGGRSPARTRVPLATLAALIPGARLIVTPEMNHNAPDVSAPTAVADLIRALR